MRIKIFAILFLFTNIAFSQNRFSLPRDSRMSLDQTVTSVPFGKCGTVLITDELIQQAIENTRKNKPGVYDLMQRARLEKITTAQDTIGTRRNFFVLNFQTNDFDNVTAELRAKGSLSQIWVDTTEMNNQHVTQVEVDSLLRALENSTPPASRDPSKGIIELDEFLFGPPPNIDGDGITDFLIVDIKDGAGPNDPFVAGFFFSNDQNFASQGSNKRDILYIDSFPAIFSNDQRRLSIALSTLAHEFQHLIHWHFDQDETSFVNEGLSEVAEALCGYGLRSPSQYFNNTDVPLFNWNRNNALPDAARAALFTLYYDEQLGDAALKLVVAEPANRETGIQKVMDQLGVGMTFEQMFTNFCIANYLNNREFDSRFGYVFPIAGRPQEVHNHSNPNQNFENETVSSFAVDYIVYSFGDSLEITFTSLVNLDVLAIKIGPGDSILQVDQVNLGTPYSVPEFGSSVRKIIFAVINNTLSRATYSYHSTGVQKGFISELAHDDGTPDAFSGNATFLGFGNNRQGFGWAVKFVPEVPDNKLVAAKILAAFDQEFQGSNTPDNAPKDFLFHVWDDNNGLPGNDIIEPFIVSTDRAAFTGDFIEIDLSQFADQLTNLGTVYIGFTENDSVGTFVGMDNSNSENFTFAFFGPTAQRPNEWFPMSRLQLQDGTSLSGWNMMMRATFEFVDTSVPVFTAGFFQNPLFTEELDVFMVGSTPLSQDNLVATLTQNNQTRTLSLEPVPNSSDRVFVDDGVTLTQSGPITIQVRGTPKFGFNEADTTFTFNVQLVTSLQGGQITSTDGRIQLKVPQQALDRDVFLVAMKGNANVLNDRIEKTLVDAITSIYTLSPVGLKLNHPATLKFRLTSAQIAGVNPQSLALLNWQEDHWVEVPAKFIEEEKALLAEISHLGYFTVAKKGSVTEVEHTATSIPKKFALYQNYPNPFNPTTLIQFDLPQNAHVQLNIYNLLGNKVRTLVNQDLPAGSHQISWDGRDGHGNILPTGIYFYKIIAGDFVQTRKMILAK